METKFGFTKMNVQEFEQWLNNLKVARTILRIQQHHTYLPSYAHFNGSNHFEMQRGMKNHHVNHNGWSDIGQQFTVFPDGTILTGRSMEQSPACIYGQNSGAVCMEHVGDFDVNKDVMTSVQKDAIVRVTAKLCTKFNLAVNTNTIVYHHWFNLNTGTRNNGTGSNKSCPGTAFFGGNKVADCETNFLPLVKGQLNNVIVNNTTSTVLKNVVVTTDSLNIRVKPDSKSAKVKDREPALLGAILRVFEDNNGWYKISGSSQHWVMGKYTTDVRRATVNADVLNVRSGPDTKFEKVGSFTKNEELFIVEEKNNWCKVSMDEKWVSSSFLNFSNG